MRRVVPVVVGVLLAAAVLPFLPTAPAGAASDPPMLVSPADAPPNPFTENPVFVWEAPPSAVRYVVQVSASPSMTPLVSGGSITTTNVRATYTQELPLGTLYWRVGAYDTPSGGSPVFSEIRSFTKGALGAPTLTAPADDATLAYPDDPPSLTWEAVPGAKSYEVIIDDDALFTPPYEVSKTTANTTLTLDKPLTIGQNWFWQVRAKSTSNDTGDWSATRFFHFSWDQNPLPISPGVDVNTIPPNTLPVVEQVEFVWTPITGAVAYDLEYSNNIQFSSPTKIRVQSTRYSPPETLNNGSYFWHVRGVTSNGTGDYREVFTFERAWPGNSDPAFAAITLQTPANGVVTPSRVPTFSWTPQRLASEYELQISTSSTFSSSVSTYTTKHTTFTPTGGAPNPGSTYYWRVRGKDQPGGINGVYTDVYSPVFSFIYYPTLPTITGPAPGSYVAPRLTWSQPATESIGRYRVTVYDKNASVAWTKDTFQTVTYPEDLDPAGSPYTFAVQTIDASDRKGPLPTPSQPFSVIAPPTTYPAANPTTPVSPTPHGTHVPEMTWLPVTDATSYDVEYAVAGTNVWFTLDSGVQSTGFAYPLSAISPGDYDWRIEAKKGGTSLGYGSVAHFTVDVLANSQLLSPTNCPPNVACTVNYDTPTLSWNPVPGAVQYRIWMAYDVNFTNQVSGWPRTTMFATYTPTDSLPDNQAGQAYYWYAQPIYGSQAGTQPQYFVADPPNSPVRAFRKIAKPVPLLSPAPGAVVTTSQVTFTWQGFLQTNQQGAPADRVTQEAKQYRVQVSNTADFSSLVDNGPYVDQTTYTAFNKTYPEGQLWWRVVIRDGSDNLLTLPPPQTFTKSTPVVNLVSPAAGATTPSTPTLIWQAKTFAKKYEVEVYKNVNEPLTTSNRVWHDTTEFPATTPTSPLPRGTYGWRVRHFDSDDRAGAWTADDNSTLRLFTVSGTATTLLEPPNNATVDPAQILFSWTTVDAAVKYRIETNPDPTFIAGDTESVDTVMTSWAPRSTYANGFYYWRVSTLDADNNVVATSAVRGFSAGAAGSKYVSIAPTRILDTRSGPQWTSPSAAGKIGNNQSKTLKVAGGSLPAPITANAVVLNVTAVQGSSLSFFTLYPTGSPIPTASNLNFNAGAIVPNLVTVKVGQNGNVNLFNALGNVDVVADMVGYYDQTSGDQFNPLTPSRLLDSRSSPQWSGATGKIGSGQTRDVQVAGQGGVPADAKAAIVNITVTDSDAQSFLTAYPKGGSVPTASNLNFLAGQIVPNLAIVKLGTGGKISIFNAQGSTNVIVDVVGYFATGSGSFFHELEPNRILDTRIDNGLSGAFNNNQARDLQVGGRGGVPTGANAVVMNTTAVEGTALSFLTVYPDQVPRPTSSNLNFSPGQIIPNLVTVGMSPSTGKITIYNNSGRVNVLGDVVGYYSDY